MILNENTALISNKVVLVPYEESHVVTYSEWMSDEALRTLTASDRLSLPEEYAMQKSWRTDSDKLTFICALPAAHNTSAISSGIIRAGIDDQPELLIGDVNLFISPDDDDKDNTEDDTEANYDKKTSISITSYIGEIELMIARPSHRGLGLGKIIVLMFLQYVLTQSSLSNIHKIRCKIGEDNVASLRLFEGLGFSRMSEEPSRYFREWEVELDVGSTADQRMGQVERLKDMLKGLGVEQIVMGKYER